MNTADPYLSKDGVLKNFAGIADPIELAAFERDVTLERLARLDREPIPGSYDLDHLRHFHRMIFGHVYPWAGELRTVDIMKDHSYFARAEHLRDSYRPIAAATKNLLAAPTDRVAPGAWARDAADVFGDLNAWHGFREGNGRTTRAFLRQLGREVGVLLDFSRVDPLQWRAASVLSFGGHNGQMQRIFESIAEPCRSLSEEAQRETTREATIGTGLDRGR